MKLSPMNDNGELVGYRFYCPGCEEMHWLQTKNNRWQFNGNTDKPTFSPSILVRGTKMTENGEVDYNEWYASGCPQRNKPFESVPTVCHSFVVDGKIQFLSDCTHKLAAQTVDLPELPY